MSISAILLAISVGAFILSKIAKSKTESILVSEDITIDEARIAELGLYVGQEVELFAGDEPDKIVVWVTDKTGSKVQIHDFKSNPIYNVLVKKPIRALVYSIYGNLVVIEIKFKDAL